MQGTSVYISLQPKKSSISSKIFKLIQFSDEKGKPIHYSDSNESPEPPLPANVAAMIPKAMIPNAMEPKQVTGEAAAALLGSKVRSAGASPQGSAPSGKSPDEKQK